MGTEEFFRLGSVLFIKFEIKVYNNKSLQNRGAMNELHTAGRIVAETISYRT